MAKNEGLLEEEAGRRGRQHFKRGSSKPLHSSSGGKVGALQLSRMASGAPQAVLKVTSFSSGHKKVSARLSYISREGDLELEDQDGNIIEDKEEVLNEWSVDFRGGEGVERKRQPRDTMNIVLSTPAGSDIEASHEAARQFLKKEFSENHSYVFAGHDDTDHYHVHAIIKYKGHDGTLLRANKHDLRKWRSSYAEHCRGQGIEVQASTRTARGYKPKKAIPISIFETEKRGTKYHKDRWAEEKSIEVLTQLQAQEARQKSNNQHIQKEYLTSVTELVNASKKLPPNDQAKILVKGAMIADFAIRLPKTHYVLDPDQRSALEKLALLDQKPEKIKQLDLEKFNTYAKSTLKILEKDKKQDLGK